MDMCNIEIIVTLKEPAIFAAGHEAGNLVSTRDYIPGNVILGAFVERFLYQLKHSTNEPEFKQFFLSDAVRFENLYPAGGEPDSTEATTPIPFSTLTCKDYEGLNKKEFKGDEHPYTDFLLGEMRPECEKEISSHNEPQRCGAPLKNREGFYYSTLDGRYDFRVLSAKVIRMHNVIDDASQRPTEEVGGVFSFEALEEEQFFRGFISFCNETLRDKFKNLLFGGEKEIDLYLGRARRRGYGEAKLRVIDFESPDDIPKSLLKGDFDFRWNAFQAKMANYFSITLHSDAIVADRFLRYHTTLTESLLAVELSVPADALKRLKVFSRHITVDGFSGIHKLPLESEVAIAKGSVFLFMIEKNNLLTNIEKGLQKLEEEGIGFRRNEGFGRLIVCDNYHLRRSNLKAGRVMMTKSLQNSEKEALVSLYLSEAIQNFSYPDDDFFRENGMPLRKEPKSAQLNGLWQMVLNAENINEMCAELVHKASKATLSEWHIKVFNTLERPKTDKKVELWKFLAVALIDIREKTDSSFLGDWLAKRKRTLNAILRRNGYEQLTDITLSDQQRLELARSFIHRFVTRIIVRRK